MFLLPHIHFGTSNGTSVSSTWTLTTVTILLLLEGHKEKYENRVTSNDKKFIPNFHANSS
jgi:hypothetical protein